MPARRRRLGILAFTAFFVVGLALSPLVMRIATAVEVPPPEGETDGANPNDATPPPGENLSELGEALAASNVDPGLQQAILAMAAAEFAGEDLPVDVIVAIASGASVEGEEDATAVVNLIEDVVRELNEGNENPNQVGAVVSRIASSHQLRGRALADAIHAALAELKGERDPSQGVRGGQGNGKGKNTPSGGESGNDQGKGKNHSGGGNEKKKG